MPKHQLNLFEQSTNLSCNPFETKEEYLTYLIRTKEIQKDTRRYNDGLIHLKGRLKIDTRVKKGLNWNDVVATSAVVDSGMISRYQYLPRTLQGVKTSLEVPSLDLYMFHNNFNAICTDGVYYVGLFRISESASHLDFSRVRADLTLFYGQRIALSRLPKANNILGLNTSGLEIDCPDAYYVAKEKGCGTEILNVLRPRNQVVAYLLNLIGHRN